MVESYRSTVFQNGAEFDKCAAWEKYQYSWSNEPIGFKIENTLSSSPSVKRIDRNGTEYEPEPDFFYNHELFRWPKVLLSETGVETLGSDYIGSNLDLTGASGNVMTYIPNGKYKYWYESENDTQFYLYAPFYSNYRGFKYFPHCYAGGGTLHDHFYIGTYKAGLWDDNGTLKLNSCTDVQPWTGGALRSIPFTAGNTEFTVGETITGATSGATGTVVSWHVSSGDWTGTATGTVYIRNYGVEVSTATAFSSSELLTRTSSGSASTNGSQTIIPLTIDNALSYATAKGAGWTISDIWSDAWIQGLLYTMWGTRDSQTAIGQGVTIADSGAGYSGFLNGANNINTNINRYGTGVGDGNDGTRPICVNNIHDWWGNCWEMVSGINVNLDGTYHITKRDGTGTIAGTLPENSYETGSGKLPVTGGYISNTQIDELGAITFMPLKIDGINGTSSTYYCDMFYPATSSPCIVRRGGKWDSGLSAGIHYYSAGYANTESLLGTCARLKYIPQS